MDFKRKKQDVKVEWSALNKLYPHNVLLYDIPPVEDIKINEFEELAVERLRILRIFEEADNRNLRQYSDDWKEFIKTQMTQDGLKNYLKLCQPLSGGKQRENELQLRRRDYISHFILRLAYCRTEDLRRWFVKREIELFKYKFMGLSNSEVRQFIEKNNLNDIYIPLTEEQKDQVKDGLYESTVGLSVTKIEILDFYKVHFTQVLDLVKTRRCFLKKGFAYVSSQDFVSIVSVRQSNLIEEGLKAGCEFIWELETDSRLSRLIKSLHTSYAGKDYVMNKEAHIPIESLDQLSKKSFPLCMRTLHEELRTNHHLKHSGRFQYGLFLKGIGVTVNDSVRFWREEFTKKMDLERFSKNYEYNILHTYGLKGSKVNYTPFSCQRIITAAVGAGDVAGCPYKNYDTTLLRNKLLANGISPAHLQDIMSYVNRGHYQLACGKYFQVTHEAIDDVAVQHPNLYFDESQKLMEQRAEKKSASSSGGSATVRKLKKPNSNVHDTSFMLNNANDDDELWNIAETEEEIMKSNRVANTLD